MGFVMQEFSISQTSKNPQCKLQKLVLKLCSLTEKSCAALASAGRSKSCILKELNLSDNYLYDAGVQHLSDLFKNPHCKLEKLELKLCSLTEKSCAALASASRSNPCSLKELTLSHNELHDAGVQHLSDLLTNPHCKLEKLELVGCSLTEKSSTVLASVASPTSCSLKELNLSNNELHDAGVQHLSDLFKNPHCKLEKLEQVGCSLTEKSSTVLASAASPTSCSLTGLNLSENEPQDAGVQHLSDLLKNLHCQLEKLIVHGHTFLKESPAAAASTSSSHSSDAAELQVTHKTQQDAGAQLLPVDTHTVCHQTRSHQKSCQSCAEVPDSGHWVLMKPEVSTEKSISTYSLSSPAGSYECSESGLRWSCAAPVTLQYRFSNQNPETNELSHMQFCLAGPLIDIKLMSGELGEIHLPHFLCLGGSQSNSLKDALKILHKEDSRVFIEKCELSRFHARLVKPPFSLHGSSFSLKAVVFSWREEMQMIPVDVQVYKCRQSPLTFRTYLLPENTHLCKLVEEQEKSEGFRGLRVPKPRPEMCPQINESYVLKTTCPPGKSTINPETIKLRNSEIAPNFFEVCLTEACYFKMMLLSSKGNQEVWQAAFSRTQCSCNIPQQDNMNTSTAPECSCKQTAKIQTPVKDEIPSGSSNPVQPAPVSSSLMAQTGAVAVCPSLYGNTFNGPVCFPGTDSTFRQLFCTAALQTSVDQQTVYPADVLRASQREDPG